MEFSADNRVDPVLLALGARGKFTILQVTTISLIILPAMNQLLINVFIGIQVPYQCAKPQNESAILSRYSDYEDVYINYDKCHIHVMSNTTLLEETECLYGMDYSLAKDRSFVSDFDLVCDLANMARLSQTLVIAGQGLGALVSTFISDRKGRKFVVVGFNLGILASGIIVTFSPNYIVFLLFKFVIGVFQQGLVTSFTTYLVEIMQTKDRRISLCFGGVIAPFANSILVLLAYVLRNYSWRTLELVISLISLTAVFQWWYLEESLRWLLANGKSKAVYAYIKRAAKCNGKNLTDIMAVLQPVNNQITEEETPDGHGEKGPNLSTATKRLSLLDILKVRRVAFYTVLMWLAWVLSALSYFVIYLTSTKLSGNPYLNFFLISLMELPANLIFYFCFNRIGRRRTLKGLATGLGIALLASALFRSLEQNSVTSGLALASFCVGMIGASGLFDAVFFYTPELYPTNVRNQALGVCSFMSRFGGMIAPFMGLLGDIATWGPGVLIGSMAILVALLLRFVPETNEKELPQTLEDLQLWFEDTKSDKTCVENDTTVFQDGVNNDQTIKRTRCL